MYVINVDFPNRTATLHLVDSPDKRCWKLEKHVSYGIWADAGSRAEAQRITDRYVVQLRMCKNEECLKEVSPNE